MKNFLLFLCINLLVHLPFLNLPPCGTHVWRQCNTLSMSRNFAEEGMNIFEPKIDRRNDTNGITGSHFPLFEWLLAASSKLFGFSDLLARLFSLVIFTFAMLAFFRLLIYFDVSETMARAGALLLLSIPELYYHSINAMPDNLALCLALFALVYCLRWLKNSDYLSLLAAVIFSVFAGLIKFQFLIIPFAAIAFVPLKSKDFLKFSAVCLGITSFVFLWYYYALQLTKVNNLREYGLWISPIPFSRQILTFCNNLLMDFPEVLLGYPLFIAIAFISPKGLKSVHLTKTTILILLWFVMFVAFYFAAIERMRDHTYYFMPLLPLLVFIFMLSANKISLKPWLIILVLVLNFTWAFVRIVPARWTADKMQIPEEFSNVELRNEFSKVIPINSKCVAGPDISGCIFFYFTHTKGYSFEHTSELVKIKENKPDIDNMRAAGIQYLIIRDGALLQPFFNDLHLKRKVKAIGEFEIWEL